MHYVTADSVGGLMLRNERFVDFAGLVLNMLKSDKAGLLDKAGCDFPIQSRY